MKKILVVVDMQNDFIDGPLGTPEARAIVDNVCAKIREGEWDEIITTQDTHDEMYLKKQEGKYLPIEHCQEGTEGWNLHTKIFGELINRYFWTDTFKNTFGSLSLVNHLRVDLEKHPELTDANYELTLIGVCTDICVISNALLLKAHYPEMKIVVDAACCAGTTPEKHRMALEVMKSCQVEVENMPEDWAVIYSSPIPVYVRDDRMICENGFAVKED